MTIENSNRSVIPKGLDRVVRKILRKISVGNNVNYGLDFRVGRGAIVGSSHGLEIGNQVAIGPRSVVQIDGSIGDFVMIGMHVQIIGREDHDISEVGVPMLHSTWVGDREMKARDMVVIERDVWIGAASVVLGGITIGESSVIGAGSIVTKDVPAFAIVAGNPARVVKYRFDSDAIRAAHSRTLDSLVM